MDAFEKTEIFRNMLQHVEQTCRGKSAGSNVCVIKRPSQDMPYTALYSVAHAIDTGFDQDDIESGILNRPCHAAIASPDVKKRAWRRKLSQSFENAEVSVPEPEGGFFHRKAKLITFFRVRYCRCFVTFPPAPLIQFKAGGKLK